MQEKLLFEASFLLSHRCSNRKKHIPCDLQSYKDRDRIERIFNKLRPFRRIAICYNKARQAFIAFLYIASEKLWSIFVNRT
ncbi:Transposase-like protein [Zymomonas mobilis subsp. mobilis str. CP4 = NRRL B-14023]|nr:Transposase-like protein [Zymomonas mobilis subsp. mobilis NRRL B-12526]AHJ72152.1 Transposase-like protein [Zymomonas mobilis subsp. mobilis str. CP4 = NRRL B-14023]